MSKQNVDTENLTVTGTEPASEMVSVRDGVVVVINQAYGPTGEKLVGISNVTFDGFPAVSLLVRAGDQEGLVHLSPIHGDRRKEGLALPAGTKCELLCPVSKQPLDKVEGLGTGGVDYFALYLSAARSMSSAVYLSDVWDHYESRVMDNDELISQWVDSAE